jgi:hypothetical protein
MAGEGFNRELNLWSSLGILGGGVLTVFGSSMVMLRMTSHSAGGDGKPGRS